MASKSPETNLRESLHIASHLQASEKLAIDELHKLFYQFSISDVDKFENFPLWVRHRDLARFLYKAEIYKSIINVPGSVMECGVLYGGSMATWLHLGEIFEPVNYGRRVIGLDTFEGFPRTSEFDSPPDPRYPDLYQPGTYNVGDNYNRIRRALECVDATRKLAQLPRLDLIKGDILETLPRLLESDQSLQISILYLDLDLYEPTRFALEQCLPRMMKGSVVCIDELCYPDWPGETRALRDVLDLRVVQSVERSPIVPNIAVIRL